MRHGSKTLLEEYNSHMLQVLTIHEAYPGHYVQLDYANRNPSLIRRVLGSGVYIEGWAVYCEQMMLDQGYADGDLRVRLMQLKFQLRPLINAILDHKMHCGEMTDEEALALMIDEGYQSDGEARLEDHPREAVVVPAFDLFRRPHGDVPRPRKHRERNGRQVRPCSIP